MEILDRLLNSIRYKVLYRDSTLDDMFGMFVIGEWLYKLSAVLTGIYCIFNVHTDYMNSFSIRLLIAFIIVSVVLSIHNIFWNQRINNTIKKCIKIYDEIIDKDRDLYLSRDCFDEKVCRFHNEFVGRYYEEYKSRFFRTTYANRLMFAVVVHHDALYRKAHGE